MVKGHHLKERERLLGTTYIIEIDDWVVLVDGFIFGEIAGDVVELDPDAEDRWDYDEIRALRRVAQKMWDDSGL